jgi:alpha-beta hydrolase superfamily lysophospholipase
MLHGLESHSGWFVQSARHLAELGLPVYAFDRGGSGVSESNPEAASRLSGLLAEVDDVADHALAGTGFDSIHLVGHCFGAIVALHYAALYRPSRVASLVLATPALYTRSDARPSDKVRIVWSVLGGHADRVPVPLLPEQFSELAPFVEFVRGDPLALKTVPARLLYEVSRARGRLPKAAGALQAPLLVAMAGDDRICDNVRVKRLIERITAPKEVREYAGARHILEYSCQREEFLSDLGTWFARQESH